MSFDLRPRKRAGAIGPVGNPFLAREEIPFARKGLCFLQHDMDVANASGATVRGDFNNAIEALATLSSGATEPGTTYAYQLWADTTAGLLKQRNAANGAWEVRGTLAETLKVARSSDTILAAADYKKFFVATGSFTQTLTAAATLGDGWYLYYRVDSGVTLVLDPNSSENIDGATTKTVVGPCAGVIACDGSAFFTYGFDTPSGTTSVAGIWEAATQAELDAGTASRVVTSDLNKISLGTPAATTSGTSLTHGSIPSGVRRIVVSLVGVSSSGTSSWLLQLGDAGGLENSGYAGAIGSADTNGLTPTVFSAGFIINVPVAAGVYSGQITLELEDSSTNTWSCKGILTRSDVATIYVFAGSKALSAVLTQVGLTTAGGTDTFDAGAWNITYER